MSFQTSTTFVHLQNTNEDLFDEIGELSVPPLTAIRNCHFDPSKNESIVLVWFTSKGLAQI